MRGGMSVASRSRPIPSLWLDHISTKYTTSAQTTLAENDNDTVGSWLDRLSPGIALNQSTLANCPLLKTNVLNGKSVLDFDGVNDSFSAAWTALTGYTVFIVAKKKSAPSAAERTLLGVRLGTGTRTRPIVSNSGGIYAPNYGWFADEAVAYRAWPTSTPVNWNILSFTIVSAASAILRVNGGVGTTFDPHNALTTGTTFSLCVDNTTNFGDYQIAEFRRYATPLARGDLNYAGKEIGDTWGLTWDEAA